MKKPARWSPQQAHDWYNAQPWLVGCNYTPRTAINQLEMWQKNTFKPSIIRQELKWASNIGMNTARVFLHDLLWLQDREGFLKRIDNVLKIADRQRIGVMLVIFDSVWDPFPHPGRQREPVPGVHNSGWVQSPGMAILQNERKFNRLKRYVTDVVKHFGKDPRVRSWDLWNEPDNTSPRDLCNTKAEIVAKRLPQVFEWARSAKPSQPLTCGVWAGDWTSRATLKPIEKLQIDLSDVISFHCYGPADDVERRIVQLQQYGRPLLCTEFMSRTTGSTFQTVLPVLKKHRVGAYCWGLVDGRTQTKYPWDSWKKPYTKEPNPWFHEVFRADGSPYDRAEVRLIKSLTSATP